MRGFSGKLNVPGRAAGTDEWQYRLMRESAQSPSAEAPTVFSVAGDPENLGPRQTRERLGHAPRIRQDELQDPLERRTPAPQNRWV
jgi:hypothetical protein